MPEVYDPDEPNYQHDKPEWDESKAGPEYHLRKRFVSRLPSPMYRCLLCWARTRMSLNDLGPSAVCMNPKCQYVELI